MVFRGTTFAVFASFVPGCSVEIFIYPKIEKINSTVASLNSDSCLLCRRIFFFFFFRYLFYFIPLLSIFHVPFYGMHLVESIAEMNLCILYAVFSFSYLDWHWNLILVFVKQIPIFLFFPSFFLFSLMHIAVLFWT